MSNKYHIIKENLIKLEDHTAGEDSISLEATIALLYVIKNYYLSPNVFSILNFERNEIIETGMGNYIIKLIEEVGITISSKNSMSSLKRANEEMGDKSFNYFLNPTPINNIMLIDISFQIMQRLKWCLKLNLEKITSRNVNYDSQLIIKHWKNGSVNECTAYYNQNVQTLTGLNIRANSEIVQTFREKLNFFSVSQIHKTIFNSCNFTMRILIEKRIDTSEFNSLFINYYNGYFLKAKNEGWENNIKGYDYRYQFMKMSTVTKILFNEILKISIDPYGQAINLDSLNYLKEKMNS